MAQTPESNLQLENCKGQRRYEDCSDSGYSGFFQSPLRTSGVDSCHFLSPVEFNDAPKENLRLCMTPKGKVKESVEFLDKGPRREALQPASTSWCETPKVYKRDATVRQRLLMCKPKTDLKTDNTSSQTCTTNFNSSITTRSEHWLSVSFDALESVTGALASNTLKVEQDLLLCRKRRNDFSKVRTSTFEDGKVNSGHPFEREVSLSDADFNESSSTLDQIGLETPFFSKCLPAAKEVSPSQASGMTNNLRDSSSILCTPSYTHTPKYIRSVYEDSGFSSLTLDKSQDDSVDHDGSFQELLLSASRGNGETPNLAEAKRRSRLQRQHRLSTLKEGGSQSEEDSVERKHQHHRCLSHSKDVFDDFVTPRSALSAIHSNSINSDGVASVKQDTVTPLRPNAGKPENSFNMAPTNSDDTPLRTTPVNLSLTPALQLVHAMCQQRAQMFFGQSPSLKEQLKPTLALADTPQTFRTTMPLAGLIGRKMGIGKVDILTELNKRNLRHVLALIFSHLTSEEIYRCGLVCKTWNKIILEDKKANFRRRLHLSEVVATPELSGARYIPDADTRQNLLERSVFRTVQALSRTSSYWTPQSGNGSSAKSQHTAGSSCSSSSKRDRFLEVAKTLFNDECLKPCPRCQNPARCHSVKMEGVCSRDNCGFQFCTACLCAFHGSRECGSQSVGRHKKDIILPGSAQSKRNVRRL